MVYSRGILLGPVPLMALLTALLGLALSFSTASASLGGLNSRLNALESRVNEALSDPAAASSVITQLDEAEGEFEEAANSRNGRGDLIETYLQLESMLNRIYQAYQHKKDACIAQIDAGGNCDYDQPEQLALRALYPLSWLHYRGALLYSGDPTLARRLLNQAIDGFTSSTLVIFSPELIRENLLGKRARRARTGQVRPSGIQPRDRRLQTHHARRPRDPAVSTGPARPRRDLRRDGPGGTGGEAHRARWPRAPAVRLARDWS